MFFAGFSGENVGSWGVGRMEENPLNPPYQGDFERKAVGSVSQRKPPSKNTEPDPP